MTLGEEELERVYRAAADYSVFTPHRDGLRAVADRVRAEAQAAAADEIETLRSALGHVCRWWEEPVDRDPEAPPRYMTAEMSKNSGGSVYRLAKSALNHGSGRNGDRAR